MPTRKGTAKHRVTWKELKEAVDNYLKENGRSENVEVNSIQVIWPDKRYFEVNVKIDVDGLQVKA